MNLLIPALALGFLGSFHCVGMCGPIALALPVSSPTAARRTAAVLMYNLGRIFTYAVLGLLFGLLGKGFVLAGYQQGLSITLGILILLIALLPARLLSRLPLAAFISSLFSALKTQMAFLFKTKSIPVLGLIGLLNGLLPCGLVYLGISASMATGNPFSGSLAMIFFGLGTVPAMLSVGLLGSWIGPGLRGNINRSLPVFISIMAILLILRGMNLGIPYLSPELSKDPSKTVICCHK